jgi:hypothetical protein
MTACHRCGVELVWAMSERNKRFPLEPANGAQEGLFILRRPHRLGPPQAIAVGPALFDDEPKYVYHQCRPADDYNPKTSTWPEGF